MENLGNAPVLFLTGGRYPDDPAAFANPTLERELPDTFLCREYARITARGKKD
jgi:hypothetical protein